jgi:hypothetical protein
MLPSANSTEATNHERKPNGIPLDSVRPENALPRASKRLTWGVIVTRITTGRVDTGKMHCGNDAIGLSNFSANTLKVNHFQKDCDNDQLLDSLFSFPTSSIAISAAVLVG